MKAQIRWYGKEPTAEHVQTKLDGLLEWPLLAESSDDGETHCILTECETISECLRAIEAVRDNKYFRLGLNKYAESLIEGQDLSEVLLNLEKSIRRAIGALWLDRRPSEIRQELEEALRVTPIPS